MRKRPIIYPARFEGGRGGAHWIARLRNLDQAAPLIVRELRAESRRPVNFGLRVLAAALLVSVFAVFTFTSEILGSRQGAILFYVLYRTLILSIWVMTPLMTADCLSREKREGTLGLLFLTPLTVFDVIAGKAAIHILRAVTLLVASLPILMLPFMLGGVSWWQALYALVMVMNALLMGIAAGIYASAKGGSAIQVMVLGVFIAGILAVISLILNGMFMPLFRFRSMTGFLVELGIRLLVSLVLFFFVMRGAQKRLQENWDRDSAAPEQPQWVKLFSTSDFWRTIFRWERGPALDRNPIAWLQEYSWTARLTKWGWCVVLLLTEFVLMSNFPGSQSKLTAVLAMGVAFSAAISFRRERESGLLEILLVTPLSVRQLVGGRMWGICCHFIPAAAVLLVFWNGDRLLNQREFVGNQLALVFPNPIAFLAVIMVGLYVSLWRLNFLLAWLVTWVVGYLVPVAITVALGRQRMAPITIILLVSMLQVAIAMISWVLIEDNMRRRRFLEVTAN